MSDARAGSAPGGVTLEPRRVLDELGDLDRDLRAVSVGPRLDDAGHGADDVVDPPVALVV
jgi:hypothetical protein